MNKTKIVFVLFCLILTVSLFASDNPVVKEKLKVTLLIFSGMENPTFEISESLIINTIKELALKKTKINRSFQNSTVIPSRLGYSGVIVENVNNSVVDLPGQLKLNGKDIEFIFTAELAKDTKTPQKEIRSTDSLDLENLILQLAVDKGVITSDLLKIIKNN